MNVEHPPPRLLTSREWPWTPPCGEPGTVSDPWAPSGAAVIIAGVRGPCWSVGHQVFTCWKQSSALFLYTAFPELKYFQLKSVPSGAASSGDVGLHSERSDPSAVCVGGELIRGLAGDQRTQQLSVCPSLWPLMTALVVELLRPSLAWCRSSLP